MSATTTPAAASAATAPEGTPAWRVLVRMAAALVALGVFAYWSAAGYNRGWTKNRVPIAHTDEFTGIEYVEYEQRFVPGIEILVGGIVLCAVVGGITFLPRKTTRTSHP